MIEIFIVSYNAYGVELFEPKLQRIIMWHFHWNQKERENKTESVCFIFQFHQILCGYYCSYSTCIRVRLFSSCLPIWIQGTLISKGRCRTRRLKTLTNDWRWLEIMLSSCIREYMICDNCHVLDFFQFISRHLARYFETCVVYILNQVDITVSHSLSFIWLWLRQHIIS